MPKPSANGKPKYKGKKRGPKGKLTPAALRRVRTLVARGCTDAEVAHIIGINPDYFATCKTKYISFQRLYNAAKAKGTERRLARIESAGERGLWQADAWYLERTQPERFGRRDQAVVTSPEGGPVQHRIEVVVVRPVLAAGGNGKEPEPKLIDIGGTAVTVEPPKNGQ